MRSSDPFAGLAVVITGLDGAIGTLSVAINGLLGTLRAGGATPQSTADAIATILKATPTGGAFAYPQAVGALTDLLRALDACKSV